MTYNSPESSAGCAIAQNGKLRVVPGIYKIRNLASGTYLDTKGDLRHLCGRLSTALDRGRGQREIRSLGPRYTIRKGRAFRLDEARPVCIMLDGMSSGHAVSVSDYPVAWKIRFVDDVKYRGFGYVRFFWGSTNMVWDLALWGSKYDGTKVQVMENSNPETCWIWELIPVGIHDRESPTTQQSTPSAHPKDSVLAPPYEASTGNRCRTCSHVTTETEDHGFGTTVTEVATVTTRIKYRVEGS